MILKIFTVGDVVGSVGVGYISERGRLRTKARELGAHITVVNGENSADGNGMTASSADAILDAGADVVTGGNHTLRRYDVHTKLDDDPRLLRPANLPGEAPGTGYTVVDACGVRVLVANIMGQVYMDPVNSPFETLSAILAAERGRYDIAVVDLHAEATSEKLAVARFFDGKVSVVAGTHTHVPTADCTVLPGGTGYITDLGMTGSQNGILGVRTDCVVKKLAYRLPVKFEGSTGDAAGQGALFEVDADTGKCVGARQIFF